ncbi:MAG: hypothetical protein KA354_13710 [Phycisphaerae bacterium]|nr:hypothetical protein [Phycisphaerae bacterium]
MAVNAFPVMLSPVRCGPGRDLAFDGHVEGLSPSKHTLVITLLQDKTEASRGRFLNVAGFEVLGEKW